MTGSFIGGGNGGFVSGTLAGTGKTVIKPGATAEIVNSSFDIKKRTLVNEASLTVPEHTSVTGSEGASIVNRGTMTINGINGETVLYAESGGATLTNKGTLQKTESTSKIVVRWSMDNEGTVSVTSGELEFATGGGTSGVEHEGSWSTSGSGTNILFASGAYALGSTASLSGSIEIGPESTVTAGKNEGLSANVYVKEGVLEVTGTTASSIKKLQDTQGTLQGSAEVNVTGSFIGGGNGGWVSGTLAGAGKTVIAPGATGEIVNQFFRMKERSLVNEGTLKIRLEAEVEGSEGAAIINRGTFIVNGERNEALSKTNSTAVATLVNAGRLVKTEGTGTTHIGFTTENLGTVEAQTGRFEFRYPVISRESSTQWGEPESVSSTPGQTRASCGDPVNCATGNDTETQADFAIGGRGVGLDLTRTYNSQAGAEGVKGVFGYGWTSSFSDHLVVNKETTTLLCTRRTAALCHSLKKPAGRSKRPCGPRTP